MYLRSLSKELHNNGSSVIQSNDETLDQFNNGFNIISKEDKVTGHIYILSSLSKKTEIHSIKNLYKIGFCTTSIESRIENARNETTFLMSPVKIIAAYKTFNINPQKFENLIHNFFRKDVLI